MIIGLSQKGWTKNEIVAEIQRVWGQDTLILNNMLYDDRPYSVKFGLPLFLSFAIFFPLMVR